jgi:hypothetical protein
MSARTLRDHLNPFPPVLTFGEVVAVFLHWNIGPKHPRAMERNVRQLRECGVLVSANGWADGQRARYAAREVQEEVLDVYPNAQAVVEFYPIKRLPVKNPRSAVRAELGCGKLQEQVGRC